MTKNYIEAALTRLGNDVRFLPTIEQLECYIEALQTEIQRTQNKLEAEQRFLDDDLMDDQGVYYE